MTALSLKHVQVNVSCPICNGEAEKVFHAIIQCSFAYQCWGILIPDVQVSGLRDLAS